MYSVMRTKVRRGIVYAHACVINIWLTYVSTIFLTEDLHSIHLMSPFIFYKADLQV